jgi:c-di-GMP-binding flagellar brake protein YcgR
MINKEKIQYVHIYDMSGHLIFSAPGDKISFPKDFFLVKKDKRELVVVKGKELPIAFEGTKISVIFDYFTGVRMRYDTELVLGSEQQWNFKVGDGISLEERRRFYKVPVDFYGTSDFYIRNEEISPFETPAELHFLDLNLGGAFIEHGGTSFENGDQIQLTFMDGDMQLVTEVLRIQNNPDGSRKGYGTKFTAVNSAQEEKLSRFIFDCQVIERDRRRKKEEMF